MELQIQSEKVSENAVFVALSGSVDSWTSEDFRDQMLALIESEKVRELLIGMKDVKYISSQGIGALVELVKKMKSIEGWLGIFAPHLAVRRALEIVKLNNLFITSENLEPESPFQNLVRTGAEAEGTAASENEK